MTLHQAKNKLQQQLAEIYDEGESANIADLVMEKITGLARIDRLLNKGRLLSSTQVNLLENYTQQLLQNRPVQYVLGEAHFAGLSFFVNENVLIPRPETEELVMWVAAAIGRANANILDIGTGSGCIAVSLKNKLPGCKISALDISPEALKVARQNAADNKLEINFLETDILDENTWHSLEKYHCIVSNPPYVCESEKASMLPNVLSYEPHTALFVADNDPLVFYEKIARFAKQHLWEDGYLFFEINENLGGEIIALLQATGFQNVEIKKDLQGKNRMVKCLFKK